MRLRGGRTGNCVSCVSLDPWYANGGNVARLTQGIMKLETFSISHAVPPRFIQSRSFQPRID
jgi:hypothetical protein